MIAQEPDRIITKLSIRQWLDARRFADVFPGVHQGGFAWFVRYQDQEYGPFPSREAALDWEWHLAKEQIAKTS